ncbi:uncharacterized protein TNCV_4951381 [Trichonephila clavipes]|nr:uncharacterized protein TNCV_4951381 [Trichonephila clavipes]
MHRSCYEKNGDTFSRLKTQMRGQKLSDGKPLCGRNRLTEAEIDRLQAYYVLAIRRNLSSVKDMQQAIWAIFLHKLSTDENLSMDFVPLIQIRGLCEVWFVPESVARVAAIVGDHLCHTPRHGFKETLHVFLGYSGPSSFQTSSKMIMCGGWGYNLVQSLSKHGPHVFYRRKIRRASRPGKQFNLVIDEKPLGNACHVWLRIILLKYGCGQALKLRKENWLQHLGDVALAVKSTGKAY